MRQRAELHYMVLVRVHGLVADVHDEIVETLIRWNGDLEVFESIFLPFYCHIQSQHFNHIFLVMVDSLPERVLGLFFGGECASPRLQVVYVFAEELALIGFPRVVFEDRR